MVTACDTSNVMKNERNDLAEKVKIFNPNNQYKRKDIRPVIDTNGIIISYIVQFFVDRIYAVEQLCKDLHSVTCL